MDFTKEYVGFKLGRINIFSVNWPSKNTWMVAIRIRNIEHEERTFGQWEFKRLVNNNSVALYKSEDTYIPVMEELESFLVKVYENE